MRQTITLAHITDEYFICRICSGFVIDPIECRFCEQVFCSNCLIGFVQSSQEHCCPHGCLDPVFEKAGHAFEKLMGFMYVGCKDFECRLQESIGKANTHEQACKKQLKIQINTDEEALAQRDYFWLDILGKALTPRNTPKQPLRVLKTPSYQTSFKF